MRSLALALPVLVLGLLAGCAAPEPEPVDTPSASPTEVRYCSQTETAPTPGAAPVIDCVYPTADVYMLCATRTQRVTLELQWAVVNADRVFFAYGEHADAEAASFTGPLPPVGSFDADGTLRHECSSASTTYTITAKGEGGTTSEVFDLLTRLSA